MGCHVLLQAIFLTQGLNPRILCLPHCQAVSLPLAWDSALLVGKSRYTVAVSATQENILDLEGSEVVSNPMSSLYR